MPANRQRILLRGGREWIGNAKTLFAPPGGVRRFSDCQPRRPFHGNQPGNRRHRRDGRHANPLALSEPMRPNPSCNGLDFATLKDQPAKTVLVILDADKLETFGVWLRFVIACALDALYRRGGEGLRTLFMLSEFAQLGHLKPIMAALGQGRGYEVRLFPVLQDLSELRAIYKPVAVAVSDSMA